MNVMWTATGILVRYPNGRTIYLSAQEAIAFAAWCIDHSGALAIRAEEARRKQEQEQEQAE